MYALWKIQGTSVHPWPSDVRFGAERRGDQLLLTIEADRHGTASCDSTRHGTARFFQRPADWPRINAYPERFTVERTSVYRVRDETTGRSSRVTGDALARGLSVRVRPQQQARLVVALQRGHQE